MPRSLLDNPQLPALVDLALAEDGVGHDVTSACLVPVGAAAVATVVARAPGVVAGLPLLLPQSPLLTRFPDLTARAFVEDGAHVRRGDPLAEIAGPARDVLGIERTLLNFLQRLSGIATLTARYVASAAGTRVRIQETRKTCPGWRLLDKYAVAVGGGLNHRLGLHDQVLIKENHLVFAGGRFDPAAILAGLAQARSGAPPGTVIEVEVEDLDQLEAALDGGADIVMLDDFADAAILEAVQRRDARRPNTLLEVSGGVTLERVPTLARLGIDRISVGALTHSVQALDLALEIEAREP